MGQWLQRSICAALACGALGSAHAQSIAAALAARGAGLPVQATEETSAPAPPTSTEGALHAMFDQAAIVFTGEVLDVEHTAGAVAIRWCVDDAIRGVAPGSYTQVEWDGLWAADSLRYPVGERALVFLHAPSVAGYTSPVSGADGVIPLRGDSASSAMDLRWVAQHVAVTDAARLQPMLALKAAAGSLEMSHAMQERAAAMRASAQVVQPQQQAPDDSGGAAVPTPTALPPDPNGSVDGAVVLGVLHAWQRSRVAK